MTYKQIFVPNKENHSIEMPESFFGKKVEVTVMEAVKQDVENMQANVYYISSITAAEFMVGARDKADLQKIEKQLSKYTVIPINTEINDIFIDLFKLLTLSHRPGIADILIAATAFYYHLPLYTFNKRHFQFIPNLQLV